MHIETDDPIEYQQIDPATCNHSHRTHQGICVKCGMDSIELHRIEKAQCEYSSLIGIAASYRMERMKK